MRAAVLAALILAACTGPFSEGRQVSDAPPSAVTIPDRALGTAAPQAALPPIPMKRPPAVNPRTGLVVSGPERLLGLDGDQVHAILGPPTAIRTDSPAQVWQYANETCVLDVFLYKPIGGTKGEKLHTVRYVEARGRSVVTVSKADCYASLTPNSS